MTIRFTRTAIIVSILLIYSSLPATATTYVRYDYTVSASGDSPNSVTDAAYLYGETHVEGEYTKVGDTGAGNYATLKFMADLAAGRVFSFTKVVGVHEGGYHYYGGMAKVEHIEIRDDIVFSIQPGTYPDGLYAELRGRIDGTYAAEVGAGAQISGWVSLGSSVFDTGILSVGMGDAGSFRIDEPISLTVMLASPGSTFSTPAQITKILSIAHHRNLCWANEYNTGAGYVIGSSENDFYGGIQITAIDTPAGVTWTSESGVFLSNVSSVNDFEIPNPAPRLLDNHPNPFNPCTTIAMDLPEQEVVSLRIFDVSGHLVRVLIGREVLAAGPSETIWNGRDDNGRRVSSGTYFYRLEAGQYSETKRMALVK